MLAVTATVASSALPAERLTVPRRRFVLTLPKIVERPSGAVMTPMPRDAVAELAIGHMNAPCASSCGRIRKRRPRQIGNVLINRGICPLPPQPDIRPISMLIILSHFSVRRHTYHVS